MFTPKYSITDTIARRLMDIQRASVVVDLLPLPASILDMLKKESMEKTVILSTKIEGNTLDEATKRKVLYQTSNDNEEQEVYNLMKALEYLDEAEKKGSSRSQRNLLKSCMPLSEYRTDEDRVLASIAKKRIKQAAAMPPVFFICRRNGKMSRY